MKFTTFMLLLLVTTMVCGSGEGFGQTIWVKDARNPVLLGGAAGTWDHHVFMSNVLFNPDSGRYEMWYAGSYGPPWRPYRIGFAWSTDGIHWTKSPGNPVLSPDPGTWDEGSTEAARVIRENGQYKMWYVGMQSSTSQVGYATSPDGTHWTKYSGNPVLKPATGNWEGGSVYTGAVVPTPGGYTMFYGGMNLTSLAAQVGRATSADGISWQKDLVNSPVLTMGAAGQWDDGAVFSTSVLSVNSTLTMWYTGTRPGLTLRQAGVATSTNGGITWSKHSGNPVLTPGSPGSWDASHVGPGTVLSRGNMFDMWYDGTNEPSDINLWKIGHATSSPPTFRLVPSQYATIQAGINAAAHGDTVLVDEGRYYENIRFRGKQIVVGSGYLLDRQAAHISRTIIDGSMSAIVDSGSAVSFVNGEDTTSVLCGFTITGGKGTKVSPGIYWPSDMRGGGVFVGLAGARLSHNVVSGNAVVTSGGMGAYAGGIGAFGNNSTYLILEYNSIHDNTASAPLAHSGGGGIAILNDYARVVGNTVEDNTASTLSATSNTVGGGIVVAASPGVTVRENLIARNRSYSPNCTGAAWGGGIHVVVSNLRLERNKVVDNQVQCATVGSAYGGGVSVAVSNDPFPWNQDTITIESNYIAGNTAMGTEWCTGGGIYVQNEKPLIQNNIIVNNTAYSGGGVGMIRYSDYITPSTPTLINNTITANRATSNNGCALASRGAWTPNMLNSIAWGDTGASEIALFDGGGIGVYYSDIKGGYPGQGNINADPVFLTGDSLYRLRASSPCIGRGVDSLQIGVIWYRAPRWDFAGNPRPMPLGTQSVDMGAHEEQITTDVPASDLVPSSYRLEQNYPNPFNPTTVVSYQVPVVSEVRLVVYDILGREVRVLMNEEKAPGIYDVKFDATDLASGVYLYRLTAGRFTQVRTMLLLK